MGKWVFWGSFAAVAGVLTIVILVIRQKIRQASRQIFGTEDILSGLSDLDLKGEDHPRSLSGCDSLLLPDILRDFPDFDVTLAKSYARDYLKKQFASKKDLTIYNIVISRYLRTETQKTIVFQAALSYLEQDEKSQKRYDLYDSYLVTGSGSAVAANCPNCGAVLEYGAKTCSYCGSRVVNVLGNCWKFTRLAET